MDANANATVITDEQLRLYLADALPAVEMARIEKAMRDSAELRDRLELVRLNRQDSSVHTLGAIWRRQRLTCPTRQQLGNYLLDILEPEAAEYFTFHITVAECPFCKANLDDLRNLAKEAATSANQVLRERIYNSSRGLLGSDNF